MVQTGQFWFEVSFPLSDYMSIKGQREQGYVKTAADAIEAAQQDKQRAHETAMGMIQHALDTLTRTSIVSVDFVEFDSINVNHGHAYWKVVVETDRDTMQELLAHHWDEEETVDGHIVTC